MNYIQHRIQITGEKIEESLKYCDFKKIQKESIRSNPVIGLIIRQYFRFDNDDEWKSGDIYDPETDKTLALIGI